jgi:hypothetical protein
MNRRLIPLALGVAAALAAASFADGQPRRPPADGPGRGAGFGWREIGRVQVPDRPTPQIVQIPGRQMYREVMICAERRTVRLRRVEMRLRRGEDQRIDTPEELRPGDCSRPTIVNRPPADIVSITLRYERDRDRHGDDRRRGRGRGRDDDDGTVVIRGR